MQEKKRRSFRCLIRLLLFLCMTVALVPLQAGAAVPEGKAVYIIDRGTNRISWYDTFDAAWDSTVGTGDFTFGLLQDLHLNRLRTMGPGRNYVLELNGHKLFKANTQGTSTTTFSPNDDCVRGQIVTFLYRLTGEV